MRSCLRDKDVLKVELQFHGGAVSQNPGDASVIFIAQDHGGYNLGNVIRAVLKGAYASIAMCASLALNTAPFSSRNLSICSLICAPVSTPGSGGVGLDPDDRTLPHWVLWVITFACGFVFQATRGNVNHHRDNLRFSTSTVCFLTLSLIESR